MKRKIGIALAAAAVLTLAGTASAHRYSRIDDGHPLRLVAHILHPVGHLLEYGIFRPIHAYASKGDISLGHKSYLDDDGTYYEWTHGDYSPSIKDVREAQAKAGRGMAK